jgi:hypothetical protein
MQALQNDYFSAYPSLKLTRDAKGVLVVEFHSNGGPFIMTAQAHTESNSQREGRLVPSQKRRVRHPQ